MGDDGWNFLFRINNLTAVYNNKILLTSECGYGHVPIEITRAKLKKLVESAKYLRTKY